MVVAGRCIVVAGRMRGSIDGFEVKTAGGSSSGSGSGDGFARKGELDRNT
jgi:hypothetical protein